jgi:hypothetical protein
LLFLKDMKTRLFAFLLAMAALVHAEIDLSKPVEAIALPDGKILRNAMLSKFGAETVLIKHRNGMIGVKYEFLPEDIRIEAEKKRPGGSRYFKGEMAQAGETIEGQVFVTIKGVSTYKFSDIPVYVFSADIESTLSNTSASFVQLPKPLGKTTTDADGRFKIKVPKSEPYLIFCRAYRYTDEGRPEFFEWRVTSATVQKKDRINLSRKNAVPMSFNRTVKIDEVE